MTDDAKHAANLQAAFDAAKRAHPDPSAELMARVLADAEAVQAGAKRGLAASGPPARRWAIFDALGGWPAMAGLTAAGIAGVWLGVSPASGLSEVLDSYLGSSPEYAVDVMPGAEWGLGWDEGGL